MKAICYFRNQYFVLFALLLSFFSFTGVTQLMYAQAKGTVKLKGGTVVALRLEGSINSEMKAGTVVDFRVLRDVEAEDKVVIKQGTLAMGTIADVETSSALGSPGKVTIKLKSVKAIDDQEIYLSGSVSQEGKEKVALSVILGILCLPLLLINGEDATIPDGYEVRAYTEQDYQIEIN